MLEKEVEAYLRDQVKALGGKAFKFISPGNAGVPDRLVILPGGAVVFAELKAPGGKLTALQEKNINVIRRMGCDAWVVVGKAEADRFIDYCKGLIPHERKPD